MSDKATLVKNIEALRSSIPDHVTLVAVSKTKPLEDLQIAYDMGIRDFGENKVQELLMKHEALPKDIRWHMIGHLQRNKVSSLIGKTHLIHGIDSIKLLREINKRALEKDVVVDGLLQIHIAQEDTKFGFDFEEIKSIITDDTLSNFKGVRIRGFMGMASFVSEVKIVKKEFTNLHELYIDIQTKHPDLNIDTLSIGMSGDYPLAIEAGSTMIRVGSAIFGERNYSNK